MTGLFESRLRFHNIICMVKKIKLEFVNMAGYSLEIHSLFAFYSLYFLCSFFAMIRGL